MRQTAHGQALKHHSTAQHQEAPGFKSRGNEESVFRKNRIGAWGKMTQLVKKRKGDICEDTSLLHGRTSPVFSSLALGPTVPTLQTQPAPGKTRDGRVTIWSHSRCALRIEFKIPASMLSATTVLPTPGSGNTQRGPGPSPDLSTSAAQLSRRLGDNRDLQGTPQSSEVLRGGLHETACRVHLAPHPHWGGHQKK